MAEVLRPAWRIATAVVTVVAPFVFGAIAGAAGSVAGLVVVFTVAGTYGARAGIFTTLSLLGLFLVGGVVLVLWHSRRHPVAPAGLVAALRALDDVRVAPDHAFGAPAVCQECGVSTAVVRVYGDPAARHLFPLELAELCARDALAGARQAISEQDEFSNAPIRIEFAA